MDEFLSNPFRIREIATELPLFAPPLKLPGQLSENYMAKDNCLFYFLVRS